MKYKGILFDVDSTLTETEGIDLLAQSSPYAVEVARITERAMQGELDFEAALRERVSLLKGLNVDAIERAIENTVVSHLALETILKLKEFGLKIGIVSGGFREIIDRIFHNWPFDLVVAHQLSIAHGKLTGQIQGELVDREKKNETLELFATQIGCSVDEMIAVGDGSNDISMVQRAGLGIAYRAKPSLCAVADVEIDSLDEILGFI
jgi:phosphoserine phosphatase